MTIEPSNSIDSVSMEEKNIEKNSIFIGNPGAGKSTILNTIFKNPIFASGVSLGEGLTHTHKTEIGPGNSFFTDTPGLADLARLQVACEEIKNAMSIRNRVQLIFVMTLESGHFRPTDLATMSTILQAVSGLVGGVNDKYGIILNKLSKRVHGHCDLPAEVDNALGRYKTRFGPTKHRLHIQEEQSAKDADNVKLECRDQIMKFLKEVPYIDLGRRKPHMDANTFRNEMEWMDEEEQHNKKSASKGNNRNEHASPAGNEPGSQTQNESTITNGEHNGAADTKTSGENRTANFGYSLTSNENPISSHVTHNNLDNDSEHGIPTMSMDKVTENNGNRYKSSSSNEKSYSKRSTSSNPKPSHRAQPEPILTENGSEQAFGLQDEYSEPDPRNTDV